MDIVFILTLTLVQALHLVLTPLKKLYSVVANLARLAMAWIWWFVVCILVLLIYIKLVLSFNVWNTTFVYFLPCMHINTLNMLIYYSVTASKFWLPLLALHTVATIGQIQFNLQTSTEAWSALGYMYTENNVQLTLTALQLAKGKVLQFLGIRESSLHLCAVVLEQLYH